MSLRRVNLPFQVIECVNETRATGVELEVACQAASSLDFDAALPDGYETVVGEPGYRLGGDETQPLPKCSPCQSAATAHRPRDPQRPLPAHPGAGRRRTWTRTARL